MGEPHFQGPKRQKQTRAEVHLRRVGWILKLGPEHLGWVVAIHQGTFHGKG